MRDPTPFHHKRASVDTLHRVLLHRGVEKVPERARKHIGAFSRIECHLEIVDQLFLGDLLADPHETHTRPDRRERPRQVAGEGVEVLYGEAKVAGKVIVVSAQADFLLHLAARGAPLALESGVRVAARQRDVAGEASQFGGSFGQNHSDLSKIADEKQNKHRRPPPHGEPVPDGVAAAAVNQRSRIEKEPGLSFYKLLQKRREIVDIGVFVDDLVGGLEQRELLAQVEVLQEDVHLLGRQYSLRRAPVEQLLLGLPRIGAVLNHVPGDLDVSAASAGGDEVGHSGALLGERGGAGRGIGLDAEFFVVQCKLDGLFDSDSHHCSFGVVAPAGALDEPGGTRDDVLERSGYRSSHDVLNDVDVEISSVERFSQDVLIDVSALAPEVVRHAIPSVSVIDWDNNLHPCGPTSKPFKHEMALTEGLTWPTSCLHTRGRNWWGMLNTNKSASSTVATISGTARKFSGNLIPGKYLTFSWSSLMMSVNLRPSTSSWNTHMLTFAWKISGFSPQFSATILATAVPQLPDPITATRNGATILYGVVVILWSVDQN